MHEKSVYLVFTVFMLGVLVASCSSTTPQLIMTATMQVTDLSVTSQESISPATSSITLTPIITLTMQSTQLTKTQTLAPLTIMTDTPSVCPPFEINTDLPDPDIPENYVGYHYNHRELPQGLVYLGGSLVSSRDQQFELGISKVDWQEDRQLIWLENLICRNKSGHPYFEIVDSFATPSLSGNETEPWVCFDGETEVHFVGGLGLYDKSVPKVTIGEYRGWPYTQLMYLYDIDFVSQEFIMLDVDSLKCLEGGGP